MTLQKTSQKKPLKQSAQERDSFLSTFSVMCLGFLADQPQHLALFLSETGITPQDLRQVITTQSLQIGLLDFLFRHEEVLTEFAQHCDLQIDALQGLYAQVNGYDDSL